jgi:hypothetical protein
MTRTFKRVRMAAVFVMLAAAGPASARLEQVFPHVRAGTGQQPTSGGGFVAGDRYVARTAAVAWSRKTNDLTLYLIWRKRVSCATLRQVITMPGHLVQVHVTDKPHVAVRTPVGNPQVAFLTIFRNPKVPTRIAGLRQGARLTFTRVDSYPGGVWHGYFAVPKKVYGDGKLYGYSGTFAAKWCELR